MSELYKIREDYGVLIARDMDGEPLDLEQIDNMIARLVKTRNQMSSQDASQYDLIDEARQSYVDMLTERYTLHYPAEHPYLEYRRGKHRSPKQPRFSGVYFISFAEQSEVIKIGISIDIYTRTKGLCSEYKLDKPVVHGWIETEDMRTVERTLHEQFADHNISGEWFNAEPILAWLAVQS